MSSRAGNPSLLFLYPLTLLLEVPGALARFLLLTVALYLLFLPAGVNSETINTIALMGASGTLIVSVLTFLFLPGGMYLTRWTLGARSPSEREQRTLTSALEQILAQAPQGIKAPTHWFVLDTLDDQAMVVGTSLYISAPLLTNPHLSAVIAHELAHINSFDGRLTLALRRLMLPPALWLARGFAWATPRVTTSSILLRSRFGCGTGCLMGVVSLLLLLSAGGLGLWLLNPLWVWYWRQREYDADAFAARCGMAGALIEYLENYQLAKPAVAFYLSEHPPLEMRIDRLLAYTRYAG